MPDPAKPRPAGRRTPAKAPTAGDRLYANEFSPKGEKSEKSNQIKGLGQSGPMPNGPLDLSPADTQDADLARETLRAVCRDGTAPAAARAQAARTLAEMAQALGRHAAAVVPVGKPISTMTAEELAAELAAIGR